MYSTPEVVVRECNHGHGLFAKYDLPALTRIGQYTGNQTSRYSYKEKAKKLAKFTDYCAEVPHNPNFVYDPTDNDGNLLESYKHNVCMYINEPPPHKLNNCAWVFTKKDNFEETTLLEIWTFREVKAGEQLYIFYGDDYSRDYAINRDKDACDSNYYNFSICENKRQGKFHFVEYPGWIRDVVNKYTEDLSSLVSPVSASLMCTSDLTHKSSLATPSITCSKRLWQDQVDGDAILKRNPLQVIGCVEDLTLRPFIQELDRINSYKRNLVQGLVK